MDGTVQLHPVCAGLPLHICVVCVSVHWPLWQVTSQPRSTSLKTGPFSMTALSMYPAPDAAAPPAPPLNHARVYAAAPAPPLSACTHIPPCVACQRPRPTLPSGPFRIQFRKLAGRQAAYKMLAAELASQATPPPP